MAFLGDLAEKIYLGKLLKKKMSPETFIDEEWNIWNFFFKQK